MREETRKRIEEELSGFPICEYAFLRPEELPFPFARTGQELLAQIRSFSQEAYLEKCGVWLSRIGYFDTGHASEAAAERIEARIQREEKRSGTGT